jgi:hypothetical protein
MARIARADYPKIQHSIEVEGRKVAEVAALHGCSSANIYAILTKLRRNVGQAGTVAVQVAPGPAPLAEDAGPATLPAPIPAPAIDLFQDQPPAAACPAEPAVIASAPAPAQPLAESTPATRPAPVVRVAAPTSSPGPARPAETRPAPSRAAGGARGMKTGGLALMMRTAEGEEMSNPFRSLEELLSAAKPILRSAASSPEPVWFSIQPVDLAATDADLG